MKVPALGALSLAMLVTNHALAWCRVNTCDREGAPASTCRTAGPSECIVQGKSVAWPNSCVSTSVSAKGSPKRGITADEMRQIVQDAFKQWSSVDCGGGQTPSIVVDTFPDVNCTEVLGDAGYKPLGPNYNVWIFRDDSWPLGAVAEDTIAITTTSFTVEDGVIFDADVELNSFGQNFTTGLDIVDIDLPSVVQHESGHFLGLAHSASTEATMYFSVKSGDLTRRSLSPDDVAGICAIYPSGNLDPNCDPEPRHGFSTECTFDKGSCTIAPGHKGRHRGISGTMFLCSLLALWAIRRKRCPRHIHERQGCASDPLEEHRSLAAAH